MTTVGTILVVVASQFWPFYQLDVKNAFLHKDLKEEVNMRLPKRISDYRRVLCCPIKALSLWPETSPSGLV